MGSGGRWNTLRGLMRKGLQKARIFPAPHRRARSTRTSARRATFSIQNERAAAQQTLQFWQWNLPNTSPFFSLYPRQQPSFRYCPSPVVSTFPAIPSSLGPSSLPEHPSSHFPQTCFIPCVICMPVHSPKCLPVLGTGQAKASRWDSIPVSHITGTKSWISCAASGCISRNLHHNAWWGPEPALQRGTQTSQW